VIISPSPTVMSTPWRTWLSPYQALRPETWSSGFISRVPRTHIGRPNPRILADRRIIALCQDFSPLQDGDMVADIGDDGEIVLDHQHGALPGDVPDDGGYRADILLAHAGHRLIEQQHLGIERQGRCDLEHALASVGKVCCQGI